MRVTQRGTKKYKNTYKHKICLYVCTKYSINKPNNNLTINDKVTHETIVY